MFNKKTKKIVKRNVNKSNSRSVNGFYNYSYDYKQECLNYIQYHDFLMKKKDISFQEDQWLEYNAKFYPEWCRVAGVKNKYSRK